MRHVLRAASILAVLAVGLWQGPKADSDADLGELSGGACTYRGYSLDPCKDYDPDCTGGQSYIAAGGGTSHQRDGNSLYCSGNCTGPTGCPSCITTYALTTYGCGG